jgi:hypothetical protein
VCARPDRGLVALAVAATLFATRAWAADGAKVNANTKMSLAFVLLPEAKLPKGEAIERAFRAYALDGQTLRVHAGTKKRGDAEALELELDGGQAFVALMPVPVPNGEADAAARFSLSALNGKWKLPPHKAHLAVTVEAKGEAMARLAAFTSLLAAVAEASSAVGVYCGAAGATHDPRFFREIASERSVSERLKLWTGVSIAAEEGERYSLLSLGMKSFELPDLLLVVPRAKADDAIDRMFSLLESLIARGKAFPEGDTVGRSASEKLKVHYVTSPVDPKAKVWRVEMK